MPQLSARSVALCRALARSVCGALALVGLAVLIGWMFDMLLLKSLMPGWAAMKPNTAVALLLAAVALWPLAAPASESLAKRPRRWLVRIAAGGITLIGALTLAQHTLGLNLGLDSLLFREANSANTPWPGRMSPLAATDFLLLGSALLLISGKRRLAAIWAAQLCALLAAFGAFIALTGYLYGREALGFAPFFTSTALHTAAALLALSVGVACARPEDGLMALFNSGSAGGAVMRRLLLPITLLPVAINWLELEGERRGVFPAGFGWMLDAALTVLLVGMLVWAVARIVHEKDVAREAAEVQLRRSEERYRQLIEMSPVAIIVKDQRRIEFANPAARALVGATQTDEMVGKSPFAFVHPESRAKFEKDFCRVLRDGTPLPRTEQRVLRLDGTELDIEFSASAVDYHGQRFAQVIAHDITEQKRTEQALRESEKRFRLIAETITEVFWMADVAGDRMVYISPAYERVWGRSCQSLYEYPRSFLDAIHLDDRPLVLASFDVQKQGKPFGHEYRVVQPDGEVRWIWDRGYPVRNESGAVLHYVGVAQDITEQRNARQEIVDALDRLNLVAQATNDVLWDWNIVTDELWWGLGKGNTLGYAQGELTGGANSWSSRIHPDERERVLRECEAVRINGGTHWSGEYRFRRRDGSYAEVLDRYSLIRDAQGKAIRAVGALMDITERRRSEAQIRFQARLLDQVRNAVIATDSAGRVIYWNSFASELYQWRAAEVLGKNLMEVLIPASERGRAATIMEEMQTTGSWEGEFMVQRKDGHIFPVYVADTLLKDQDGQITGIVGVSFDITERKRADEILRRDASILSQLHDAVICTDLAGIVTYWNDAATNLLGWTAEESIGRSFLAQHPLEEHAERRQRFQRVLAGEVLRGERQSTRKDGTRVWIASHITLNHDVLGRPVGVISISRDVTERKKAEETLKAKQAHFQRVIEDIFRFVPEALMVFTRQMALFRENKALDDLVKSYAPKLGYTEPELREALLKEVCSRVLTDDHGQIRIPRKRRNEQENHQPDYPGQSAGDATRQIP
jgi:PAS domain S-box-containing protein